MLKNRVFHLGRDGKEYPTEEHAREQLTARFPGEEIAVVVWRCRRVGNECIVTCPVYLTSGDRLEDGNFEQFPESRAMEIDRHFESNGARGSWLKSLEESVMVVVIPTGMKLDTIYR